MRLLLRSLEASATLATALLDWHLWAVIVGLAALWGFGSRVLFEVVSVTLDPDPLGFGEADKEDQ
jgi:hypothetical protein